MKYIIILISAITLVSCEDFFDSPIDYDIEIPDPKLVVNAQLSPNAPAIVEVSNSVPIFGTSGKEISWQGNAVVVLYEDGIVWDTLLYQAVGGNFWLDSAFVSSKPIQEGAVYAITVNHPDFDAVQASTRVPAFTVPITFAWVDVTRQLATIKLPALPAGQYYFIRFEDPNGNWIYFKSNNPIVEFGDDAFIDFGGDDFGFYEGWIRPERMNGTDQEIGIEFSYGITNPNDVLAYITVVDEDLFRYRLDLSNYDPDNPFNEPVQVQSNVEGGYGLFSAYASTRTPIQ